ncbi:MAG: class I SAM-dependent methyltransferase [Armatimonadota bacterium]|nr:class I SAM-dependent methyltransferase [Armatimonadota bacterium]
MARSRLLAGIYEAHNRRRGRGFVYGGPERIAALRRFLPANPGCVLDLGCRDGSLAEALGLEARRTVGVDIDIEALRLATNQARLRGVAADLWGWLPFADDSVDLVVAGEILEHLPFPEVLVSEAARVLVPTGTLLGSTPNALRLKNRLRFALGRDFEDDPTHLRHFSASTLRSLLGRYFERVVVVPCVGRLAWLSGPWLGNDIVFVAEGCDRSR